MSDKLWYIFAMDAPMPASLFEKLKPNTTILTANSRLTRYLQLKFDEYQRKQHKTQWETPHILPMSSWLDEQFHLSNIKGTLLLNDFQEQCVWEDIIQKSKLAPDLMQPALMTKLVKQAFETLNNFEVPLEALTPYNEQNEVRCLIEWITQFEKVCQKKNWLSRSEVPKRLASKNVGLPQKIILIGFDEQNPNLKTLLSQFKEKTIIETEMLCVQDSEKKQIILDNPDIELETMAKWAKALWDINPKTQIGCVIPELANIRAKVQRVFTEVFCIEHILPGMKTNHAPFNISAGTALAQQPMIQTALTLLNWCHTPLPIQNLSPLLQSPYLCSDEREKNQGAQIDALLRDKNYLQVSMADLYSAMPSIWVSRWRGFIALYHDNKLSELMPSEWVKHFIALLKLIGWPSARTQNSIEFQVLERFKKVLLEFSQLDFLFSKINFRRALHLLNSLTQQTLFQPKSHHEPIQIMGALEASGVLFDHLWVMGLHDGIWPAGTKPHPLIPYALQQQFNMPHATAKREHQFCEHMTKRLESAAEKVIFSSPAKEGDQLFSPSQLIKHITLITQNELLLSNESNYSETLFNSKNIEIIEDNKAPEIMEFSNVHGGSSILKLQALCPFRAFTAIRLKAKALNYPVIGIPAVKKGILIHQLLFEIWGEIQDQKALLALTDESLDMLIEKYSDKALTQMPDQPYQDYFYSVEKKRLKILIRDWLLFEKTRPYFRVIEREASCHLSINKLPLKIRLDRVDQLNDGSLFLIDYKTGVNTITGWFQERLSDPQLPIYAVFQDNITSKYAGIAFAEIRNGDMKYKGVIHENHLQAADKFSGLMPIGKIKNELDIFSWDALMMSWKKSLEKLSDDFCDGVAIVDPLKKEVCLTCDLKPVCRFRN
ncbi:MAG: PD-(D/E)XK nuclease family protein [Gammaproteobacteria bacterium]|nr:PD-(D/E)XK nuclease family protein [Gammaproteobacteria bacterium]